MYLSRASRGQGRWGQHDCSLGLTGNPAQPEQSKRAHSPPRGPAVPPGCPSAGSPLCPRQGPPGGGPAVPPHGVFAKKQRAVAPGCRTPPPCAPTRARAALSSSPRRHLLSVSSGLRPAAQPLRHPPGRNEVQQPVGPNLLNASVRDRAHVGQVELLIPAEVIAVGLAVRQWGAGHKARGSGAISPQGRGSGNSLRTPPTHKPREGVGCAFLPVNFTVPDIINRSLMPGLGEASGLWGQGLPGRPYPHRQRQA